MLRNFENLLFGYNHVNMGLQVMSFLKSANFWHFNCC